MLLIVCVLMVLCFVFVIFLAHGSFWSRDKVYLCARCASGMNFRFRYGFCAGILGLKAPDISQGEVVPRDSGALGAVFGKIFAPIFGPNFRKTQKF